MEWIKISEKYPPAHDLYVVSRDDHEYLATPCYGMHHPWWVVKVMDGDAEPVPMKDDDYWRERQILTTGADYIKQRNHNHD